MAEQERPVRRRVALKVIKLGMDTKSVIARFEAERQALAMMDHPNIARVLDAGATEMGTALLRDGPRPGGANHRGCDDNHLDTCQRLRTVHHRLPGHRTTRTRGIIHRDIKPSNIMVTLHDGVPVPR